MTTESPRWFKSSHSNNGGDCVEAAANLVVLSGTVPIRDSKAPHGPALSFGSGAWSSFVAGVKDATQPGV
ncbi:DUF397 domain-containing protein [Streptomyces griseocarneus]|nr:DUF397 domain-containing protein [Streptomyces griseocarneus]